MFGRRTFIRGGGALLGAAALGGPLQGFVVRQALAADGIPLEPAGLGRGGYGPLSPSSPVTGGPSLLALPDGFRYAAFGIEGSPLTDGAPTPKAHDGMAAFQVGANTVRLVRNHESKTGSHWSEGFGDPAKRYDPIAGGGTTTLEVVGIDGVPTLVKSFVSLNGTLANCAGGPVGMSWLSCEETVDNTTPFVEDGEGRDHRGSNGWTKQHGYVFEVPALSDDHHPAVPLKAMGRFFHEAVALGRDGVIYETEDSSLSGFYRFLPASAGNLAAGGRLQMLRVEISPQLDTRTQQTIGRAMACDWVEIATPFVDSDDWARDSVFQQGFAQGGARFTRCEGVWTSPVDGSIFFTATNGGEAGAGQIWHYEPVSANGGLLRLFYESPGIAALSGPDNLTVSNRGGVVLCEDGDKSAARPGVGKTTQFLRGLTPEGRIFDFAYNDMNDQEFAGACFAELAGIGQVMFVNIQGPSRLPDPEVPSHTFAIWGPWHLGAL